MALWDDLQSYWPLNGNVYDYMMTTPGTEVSSPTYSASKPGFGTALDGSSGYATFGTPTYGTNSLTFSYWVKPASLSGTYQIIADNRTGSYIGISLFTTGGGINTDFFRCEVSSNGSSFANVYSTSLPAAGTWYNVVIVIESSNLLKMYVDGVLQSNVSDSASIVGFGSLTNSTAHLGHGTTAGVADWAGLIDDVAWWDRALTADEILEIYTAGNAGKPLSELIPRRQFPDGGAATSWIDMADNTMLYHMYNTTGADTSVNSNTAVVSSATIITGKTLYSGSSEFTGTIHFDGTNTKVDTLVSAGDVGISGSFARTIMSWAKSDSWTAGKVIWSMGSNATREDFSLVAATSNRIQLNTWFDDLFVTPPSVTGWNHYAVVYSGGGTNTMSIYFNGVFLGSQIPGAPLNTSISNNIIVGDTAHHGGWSNWNGDIQEFAIFDAELTSTDILNTYNAQKFLFLGTGSQTAINLFASVVHDATPPTAAGINLYASVVHDATPPTAAGINLYASVVHDATPPTAAGINLFSSVVHDTGQISGTVADITGTVGNPATFDGTPMGVSTGSINYQWSWQSVPSGSAIVNASFPLPDSGSTTPVNMSGNVGLWHFDSESSSSVPLPPTSSIGLVDSWGDGWHGSNWVSVLVNSIVVISSATLGAGAGPGWHDYPVSDGDTVDIIYSSLGSGSPHWGSECSYILNDGASGAGVNFYTSPLFPTTPYSYTANGITTYATPDSSGQGNDATINGATQVAGRVGSNAYSFDGINDYITAPSASSLQITGNVSIAAWIKADSYAEWETIIQYSNPGEAEADNHLYSLFWANTGGDIRFFWEYGGGSNVQTDFNTNLNTGQWYHIVVVRNTSEMKAYLYLDGALFDSQTYSDNPTGGTTSQLWIGTNDDTSVYFDGTIDEVALWNRVLSPLEINQIYFFQSGSCASGSVGLGETFSFTPDVTGTYTIQLELDDSLNSMSGNVNAVISSGVTPITGTGSIEGVVWELTSETIGASVIEGNVWELSTETAGESRNEGVVWELSAEPLDKPSLNIPDITGTAGTSSCFYATASYTETGSIAYAWEWVSIPGGSLITSGSRTGFSGSGGAYSEIPTGSTACYLPDVIGSYVVKGTFYSDTGSGGGSFAFDTATGVISDPPAPPEPVITSSNPNTKLVEADDASSGYVFNTNKIDLLSVQRSRTIEQVPFIFGTKSKQTLRLRTNQEFTGSS